MFRRHGDVSIFGKTTFSGSEIPRETGHGPLVGGTRGPSGSRASLEIKEVIVNSTLSKSSETGVSTGSPEMALLSGPRLRIRRHATVPVRWTTVTASCPSRRGDLAWLMIGWPSSVVCTLPVAS